jgi:hypothetical protein
MTSSSISRRRSSSELAPPVVVDTVLDSADAILMRDLLILLYCDDDYCY